MLLKLTFREQFKMVNQMTGYIGITLQGVPQLMHSVHVDKNIIDKRCNEMTDKYDVTEYDYYLDCKNADILTIKTAINLLNQHYQTTPCLAINMKQSDKNEIIENLAIALKLAEQNKSSVSKMGLNSKHVDYSSLFSNNHKIEKDQWLEANLESSKRLQRFNCGM